jgi:hypothetical protein
VRKTLKRQGAIVAGLMLLAISLAGCLEPVAPGQQMVAPATGQAQTITVYVGPKLVDCQGVAPQKCYQVKAHPEDDYRLFYSSIQGFQYEPGYEYELRVRVEPVDNPPADASAYSYVLVDVVSKTRASEEAAQATPSAVPEVESPEAAPTVAAEGWEVVLGNLEYQSEFTQSGVAPLHDGVYSEPAAPGSASETVVHLTDSIATGDLDGDGTPDAAVVLATDTGGSGVFMDLAAVVVVDGMPFNVAIALLGDRAQINSLSIRDGEIVVDMITQGPNDPMCCPTLRVVETYELRGNELVRTSSG